VRPASLWLGTVGFLALPRVFLPVNLIGSIQHD
jgi:hypothetical protein